MMGFAAIDTETTGTDVNSGDVLLQVAGYVTDEHYRVLDDEGIEFVFRFSATEVAEMKSRALPVVQEMHEKTGLWDRLTGDEAVSFEEGDEKLAEYLSSFEDENLYLLGNSITLDRNFLERFLPKSFAVLHYRSVDVTSVRLFLEERLGAENVVYRPISSEVAHEARADILASLEQVRYYRSLI